jgi:hypothetical protein
LTWYSFGKIEYINRSLEKYPTSNPPTISNISKSPPRFPVRSRNENIDLSYLSVAASFSIDNAGIIKKESY